MQSDTLQQLLGNGAITVFILALIGLYQRIRDNRTTLRAGLEAREQQRHEHDAEWINAYRSAADKHLEYDLEMRSVVGELRVEVNRLKISLGQEPHAFVPLPSAPPLFPPLPK